MNMAYQPPYVSALEAQFPRIAEKIVLLWGYPELERFFEKLMYDDRGDREGFPPDVMSELVFLGLLHGRAYPFKRSEPKYANRGGAFDIDADPY
jgi:uncharacterized protein